MTGPERSSPTGPEPGPSATSRREVGGRDLPAAIVIGLALFGLFVGSVLWHPAAFATVIAALTVVAYIEVGQEAHRVGRRLAVPVLQVATLLMLAGTYLAGHAGQAGGIAVLLLGGIGWLLVDPERRDVVHTLGLTTFVGLWVGLLASFGVLLAMEGGAVATLAVVGAAALTDIGAYGFGVAFGRHALAPSVSPNKTWEGLLGGLAVAVAVAVPVLPILDATFTWWSSALLAIACGLGTFLGDLTESMVKRDLGVKDLGTVLPGHGGVLDRVDGILFALPIGYYVVELAAGAGVP